jgi:hypothetical protein
MAIDATRRAVLSIGTALSVVFGGCGRPSGLERIDEPRGTNRVEMLFVPSGQVHQLSEGWESRVCGIAVEEQGSLVMPSEESITLEDCEHGR